MNDISFSRPISRKELLSVIALSASGLLLPSILGGCSSSNYTHISQQIRQQPLDEDNNMYTKQLEIIRFASLAPNDHNT